MSATASRSKRVDHAPPRARRHASSLARRRVLRVLGALRVSRVLHASFAVALCAGASALISGCSSSSLGAAGGAAAGTATGIVTANPAVGIGVGIAVQAATTEAVNRYYRVMHTDQQNVIAALVGTMKVGDTRPWNVKHTLPIENGHGQVRVTRAFSSALADCKEFAFSVADGDEANAPEQWYTAAACQLQQDKRWWKWASAEPAVERWGNLQ